MQLPPASYKGLPFDVLTNCDARVLHTHKPAQSLQVSINSSPAPSKSQRGPRANEGRAIEMCVLRGWDSVKAVRKICMTFLAKTAVAAPRECGA